MTEANNTPKRRAGRRKITQDEFIQRAKAAHKAGAFNYSRAVYKTAEAKVIITCNTCGDTFEQTPRNHWNGAGCASCAGTKKLTTAEFIRRAKLVHSAADYDYSKVTYKNATSPVTVICRKHRLEFTPRPANFLNGSRCPECAKETHTKRALTTAEFISRCKAIHGAKAYDYSATRYTNKRAKVNITCNTCGHNFDMEAAHHMKGGNCPKCVGLYRRTTAEFIGAAKAVHGETAYNYSQVTYKNNKVKVTIICNQCSDAFKQLPAAHLRGHGCLECNRIDGWSRSGFIEACKKNNGSGYLYVIKCTGENEQFYKVGITSNSINRRFNGALAMPYNFEVVKLLEAPSGAIYDLETKLHKALKPNHYTPRRAFGGSARECFTSLTNSAAQLLKL